METKYYILTSIDGDYAWLTCTSAQEEPYFIARALLPMEADEGSKLKFENFQSDQLSASSSALIHSGRSGFVLSLRQITSISSCSFTPLSGMNTRLPLSGSLFVK